MNKILFFAVLALVSCSSGMNESNLEAENEQIDIDEQLTSDLDDSDQSTGDSEQAKIWLERSINEHFEQELNDWSSMATKAYYEYKTDMINSNFSHGLELDALKKKWSHKYEVSADRVGVGFLIGAQDHTSIEIKTCKALPSEVEGEYLFKLVLCDKGYDQCYESDVTVIEYDDSYAIDDVKEYYK